MSDYGFDELLSAGDCELPVHLAACVAQACEERETYAYVRQVGLRPWNIDVRLEKL